jgi:hypothetical protein
MRLVCTAQKWRFWAALAVSFFASALASEAYAQETFVCPGGAGPGQIQVGVSQFV